MLPLKPSRALPSGGRGFTLLELVVAISIFSILILIVLGTFSRFIFFQRRDIGEQRLQENVRFAMELFNREVRTAYGSTFATNSTPNDGNSNQTGTAVYFRNQERNCVTYRLNNNQLERAEAPGLAAGRNQPCKDETYPEEDYEPLISGNVNISHLTFTAHRAVVGNRVPDGHIPSGDTNNDAVVDSFDLISLKENFSRCQVVVRDKNGKIIDTFSSCPGQDIPGDSTICSGTTSCFSDDGEFNSMVDLEDLDEIRNNFGSLTNQGFITINLEAEPKNSLNQVISVQSTVAARQSRPYRVF